jgi:hypothetical protein
LWCIPGGADSHIYTRTQKCRIPAKIQLLGLSLGTALKILLLPSSHFSTSMHRSEIVALFNTLFRFLASIKAITYLASLADTLESHSDAEKGTVE